MCQYTKPAYTACKGADALVPRPVGAQGAHCIYIPLYIRNPATREPVKSRVGQPAQINKVRPRAACLSAPFVALPSHRQHRFPSCLPSLALLLIPFSAFCRPLRSPSSLPHSRWGRQVWAGLGKACCMRENFQVPVGGACGCGCGAHGCAALSSPTAAHMSTPILILGRAYLAAAEIGGSCDSKARQPKIADFQLFSHFRSATVIWCHRCHNRMRWG